MEESTNFHMENTGKLMRRSVYTFLQNYQYFNTIPLLLTLPFSVSILLSHALSISPSPPLPIIQACFNSLFHAIGFSLSSHFLSLLNTNFSQTVLTLVSSLTFALTSLVIAKLLIIQALTYPKPSFSLPFSSLMKLYKPLLLTQLCNSVLNIIVIAAASSFLFIAFNTLQSFQFSPNNPFLLLVYKTVLYSFIANVSVICNLALIVAGLENCSGFLAIHKAFLVSWNWNSITLSMNLPINLSILAVEGLFRHRVVRAYHKMERVVPSVAFEGMLIAYLYSLLIVLDTIASCLFFKSYKANTCQKDCQQYAERYNHQIKVVVKKNDSLTVS